MQSEDKNFGCEATAQLIPYSDIEGKHNASYHDCNYQAHQSYVHDLQSKRRYRLLYGSAALFLVLLVLSACRYFALTIHIDPSLLPSTVTTANSSIVTTWGLGGYLGANCNQGNPISKAGTTAPSSCFSSTETILSVQFGSVPPGSFKYCTFTNSLCTEGAVLVNPTNLQCNQLDPFDPAVHALKVVSASCTET